MNSLILGVGDPCIFKKNYLWLVETLHRHLEPSQRNQKCKLANVSLFQYPETSKLYGLPIFVKPSSTGLEKNYVSGESFHVFGLLKVFQVFKFC